MIQTTVTSTVLIIILLIAIATGKLHNVSTKIGEIIGFSDIAYFNGTQRPVLIYLNIPYAEVPTGERRFQNPVPKSPFSSPYNATFSRMAYLYSPSSAGKNPESSENCLFLNIFVPGDRIINSSATYPVMIWIHGGYSVWGSAYMYPGDVISAFGEVVVVTINYRQGFFGFFSTGDKVASGNYGLWDQRLTFEWVHDNIADFGGNPNAVTLFGESAGAVSVSYHSLYPGNKGLFHRIILQSGTVLSHSPEVGSSIGNIGSYLGCNHTRSDDLVKCLRSVPEKDILQAIKSNDFRTIFQPVVDGDMVTTTTPDLRRSIEDLNPDMVEHFASLDLLTGYNSNDGGIYMNSFWEPVMDIDSNENNYLVTRADFEDVIVPQNVILAFGSNSSLLKEEFIYHYTDWTDPGDDFKRRKNVNDFKSDLWLRYPTLYLSNIHSNINPKAGTYVYEFKYQPSYIAISPSWLDGTNNGIELPLLFGFSSRMKQFVPLPEPQMISPEDTSLSKTMIDMWTNFAKTGNPNTPRHISGDVWKAYTPKAGDYLQFAAGNPQAVAKQSPTNQRIAFYFEILPKALDVIDVATQKDCNNTGPLFDFGLDCSSCKSTAPEYNRSGKFNTDIVTLENILICLIVLSAVLLICVLLSCVYICFRLQREDFEAF
ncbi:hypothetical protein CHS0354_025646 [Potamilus streckersoni]|uniref:Carboxylic ester hydrolase n=1 Tax=Potamilus streckersoni TaxID=2493646 RepID=A0AAE0RZ80_9BIVA|nr:hypothetical protein CHS0354_025646 [Potamilus streckersoni]